MRRLAHRAVENFELSQNPGFWMRFLWVSRAQATTDSGSVVGGRGILDDGCGAGGVGVGAGAAAAARVGGDEICLSSWKNRAP